MEPWPQFKFSKQSRSENYGKYHSEFSEYPRTSRQCSQCECSQYESNHIVLNCPSFAALPRLLGGGISCRHGTTARSVRPGRATSACFQANNLVQPLLATHHSRRICCGRGWYCLVDILF